MLFENVTSFCHDKPVVVQKIFMEGFEQGDFAMENMVHQNQCQLLACSEPYPNSATVNW